MSRSEPSDKKRWKRARLARFLLRPDRWKTFKTGTFAYTLLRLVQCKLFIIIAILRYAAELKIRRPSGLGGSTPPPGTKIPKQLFKSPGKSSVHHFRCIALGAFVRKVCAECRSVGGNAFPKCCGRRVYGADRDSPSSLPRSVESDLRSATAGSAAHSGDPSSASAPASFGSRPRSRSTVQTAARRSDVQTSEPAHSLPSPDAPSLLAPRDRGKTLPFPPDVLAAVRAFLPFRHLPMLFVGTPGGSHNL